MDDDEEYDYDAQEEAAKAKEPRGPKPSPLPTMAWLLFLVAGAALCLIVAVTTAPVPASTPFLTFGGAVVGAGAVGLALQVARGRVRVPPAAKVGAILAAALVLAMAFGGMRYTYGDSAQLTASMAGAPTEVFRGTPASINGTLTITNAGSTTARLYPHLTLRVNDPAGGPVLQHSEACPLPIPPPHSESQFVELAPGGTHEIAFAIDVTWDTPATSAPPCFAYIFSAAGSYLVIATVTSAPYPAAGLPPVWTGQLFGGPVAIVAR